MIIEEQLSKNFRLHEFLVSQMAANLGKEIKPTEEQIENVQWLCMNVLEGIREGLGHRPMTVISGIRPKWLNTAVGGAKNSAHLYGNAADFLVVGMRSSDAAERIATMIDYLPIDQVIDEFGQWVHVGVAMRGHTPRGEYLIASKVKGKTQYVRAN